MNEATPLSGDGGGISAQQGQQFASTVLTKGNAVKAGNYAKQQAKRLMSLASDGNTSIRTMALIGGVAMVATSIIEVFHHFFSLAIYKTLMDVYCALLGFVVIAFEASGNMPYAKELEMRVRKFCYFLEFVWGRGVLYFVAGTLKFNECLLLNIITGCFMCFVGITYIVVGQRTANKLEKLRKGIYTVNMLHSKFRDADVDQNGSLCLGEFQTLLKSFDVDFDRRELELAFEQLDKNHDGRLTFEEFTFFWNNFDFDAEQNAQFAMVA